MNKLLIASLAVAMAAGVAGIGTLAAADFEGREQKGPDPEKKTAINSALETSDYAAFKEAAADSPMADQITEDNFDKFIEAYQLHKAGKHEEAEAIMAELGIKKPNDKGPRHENRVAMMTALDDNDYKAFKTAVADTPLADQVTEENFSKFVEMHLAMKSGDVDKADTLRDELGLPDKPDHSEGFGRHGFGQQPAQQ